MGGLQLTFMIHFPQWDGRLHSLLAMMHHVGRSSMEALTRRIASDK